MSKATPRLIVVTGVTKGLGRAMSMGFAAAGHTVAGCGRSEAGVAKIMESLRAPHRFDAVDVADARAVEQWAESVLKVQGVPDLLINNAAVINQSARLWEVPRAEFDSLIDINVKGVANVCRAFLPAMTARNSGVIVNFSSGWGRSTSPEVAPYCASKYAIEGLTHALAQELPPGMAAIPLNPGIINTAMLRSCFGGDAASYPSPEEWARRGVPFILALSPRDNGRSLSVE